MAQWKHRKPVGYVSYGSREFRPGIYAGNTSVVGSAYSVGNTPDGFVLEDRTIVSFNVPTSSGGAAPYTLNVNGTGAFPMVSKYIDQGVNPYAGIWSAVYDQVMGVWITEQGGIFNAWPVETMLRLCVEVGAHCYLSSPTYGYETSPDYWHTGLATYMRDNKPAWMTIIMEGPNETWNYSQGVNQVYYAEKKQYKRNGGQSYPNIATVTYGISAITKPSTAMGAGYIDLVISDASPFSIGSNVQTNNIDAFGTVGMSYNQLFVAAKNVGGNPNKITVKHLEAFTTTGYTGSGGTVQAYLFDAHGWYGRGLAQMGAAWAAVFGLGPKGWPHYSITCGVQTVKADPPANTSSYVERFDCNGWVLEGGTAAKTYTTAYAPATYYLNSNYSNLAELEDAFNYCVTHRSNPTARAALLAAFVNGIATNLTPAFINFAYLRNLYSAWKDYVKTKGINRCYAYEGGYSPDFVSEVFPVQNYFFGALSEVTGASKATSCVLTLGTSYLRNCYSSGDITYKYPGVNPMLPGMLLCLRGILGMTQLNCYNTRDAGNNPAQVLITGGGSADITWTGVDPAPIVGQGVMFIPVYNSIGVAEQLGTNRYPPPLVPRLPYYVVYSSGTTIRISLTKGGAAITFALGATSDNCLGAVSGWIVLSKTGTQVTIDCNSTAFSTWTAGAGQVAQAAGTDGHLNIYRSDSKHAPEMHAVNTQHFTDFLSFTDGTFTVEYPSNYLFSALGSKHIGYLGYDGNVWSILCDIYETPNPPQFQSAVDFN
jgi:hypothetical protein